MEGKDAAWLDAQGQSLRYAIEQQIVGFQEVVRRRLRQHAEETPTSSVGNTASFENRITDLITENEALKWEIANLKSVIPDQSPLEDLGSRSTKSVSKFEDLYVPYADWSDLTNKFDEARKRYNDLKKDFDRQIQINENSRRSRAKVKEDIRHWQEWVRKKDSAFNKREEFIAEKERGLKIHRTARVHIERPSPLDRSDDASTPTHGVRPQRNPGPGSPSYIGNLSSRPSTAGSILAEEPKQGDTLYNNPRDSGRNIECTYQKHSENIISGHMQETRSSQTTDTKDDEPSPKRLLEWETLQDEDDSEVPEIVFERPVKRRRGRGDIVLANGNTPQEHGNKKPRIKFEPSSSPPTITGVKQPLRRMDTLDLDEISRDVSTPRKQRQALLQKSQRESFRAACLKNVSQTRSTSLPTDDLTNSRTKSEDFSRTRASTSESFNDMVVEDRHRSEPRDVRFTQARYEPIETGLVQRGILEEIAPNTEKTLQKTNWKSSRRLPSGIDQKTCNIDMIAEDGEGDITPGEEKENNQPDHSAKNSAEAFKRIDTLLNGGTPMKEPLALTRTPSTAKPINKIKNASLPPQGHTLTSKKKQDVILPGVMTPPTSTRLSNPQPSTKHVSRSRRPPLRSLPVSKLHLENFKPNPKVNQGLNYAFAETVRDRQSRRCLPGCTKANCCGPAFRALVEAGSRPTLPRGLFESTQDLPRTEANEEDRLLRHYLGDAYVHDMTDEYREEMLIRARVQLLANQHGKHREAYQRQSSPPGFWDTEMPTTQEMQKYEEEATRRERIAVEERWREAMREGGRWLFKDE